jgi:hypothetical protein
MHTTPTKKKTTNHKKLNFFFLCSKLKNMLLLAKLPSFIYAWLLILSKSQMPIKVTFIRGFNLD